jgi:hypothetical protein
MSKPPTPPRLRALSLAALPALAIACSDPAPGTITATVYGEELIEEGIPADVTSDGWSIAFDRFIVSIGDLAARAGDAAAVAEPSFYLVDLAQPSGGAGVALATLAAPGGSYDQFSYRLAPSPSATAVNVSAADAGVMAAAGRSIWVTGRATRGAVTKVLDWGFTSKIAHSRCEVESSVDGDTVTMQATIHADHLFYDDAVSEEPNVAFQLIADADGADGTRPDGAITLAELRAIDLRALARYQVGSLRDPAGTAIANLRQYVEHQATTLGHVNGEGHCAGLEVAP